MGQISVLGRRAHEIGRNSGFWRDDEWLCDHVPDDEMRRHVERLVIGHRLALIHSEVTEALECARDQSNPRRTWYREQDGKPEGLPFELADAVIRIMDLCEWLNVDLESCIEEKQAFNSGRPMKHGKLF